MARVCNVGDLQWANTVRERPTNANAEDLLIHAIFEQDPSLPSSINFALRFDTDLVIAEGNGEAGTFKKGACMGGLIEDDEMAPERLQLPASFQHMLKRMSTTLSCDGIIYVWGDGELFIDVQGFSGGVRMPDRFLASLARKMSKWAKELVPFRDKDGVVEIGAEVSV